MNFVNSSDANWGPLSETTVSGTPYRANKDFRAFVTLPEVDINVVAEVIDNHE